jgi:hypothetical protein
MERLSGLVILVAGGAVMWSCSGETIGQPPGETGGTSGQTGGAPGQTGGTLGSGGTNPGVDPCLAACRYVTECVGGTLSDCTQTCAEVDGMTQAEARAAAACLLALTCDEIRDPSGTQLLACAG